MTDWDLEVILTLQNLGSWLTTPMLVFTGLGAGETYLLVASGLYWCLSPALGLRLGLLIMLSASFNDLFKLALHAPRPYWVAPQVLPMVTASGFGMPSGHAQHAVAMWGFLAFGPRRFLGGAMAVMLMVMIGLSRVYLGVHYPSQVLAGWGLGLVVLLLFLRLDDPITDWLGRRPPAWPIGLSLATTLVLLAVGALLLQQLGGLQSPASRSLLATLGLLSSNPDPARIYYVIRSACVLAGMGLGAQGARACRGLYARAGGQGNA